MRKRTILPLLAAGVLLIAAGPEDDAGSHETETVQRGCDEPASKQYDPPSGQESDDCFVTDPETGELVFDGDLEYTATHWTNDVECGSDHQLVPGTEAVGVRVSGNTDGSAGFLQACSDGDLPINGRATLQGDPTAQQGTLSVDGDKDNQPEQLQGWAKVDVGEQSVSCGESYSDGGRADAHNPTEDDGQQHCG